jgi:hypothetical protein
MGTYGAFNLVLGALSVIVFATIALVVGNAISDEAHTSTWTVVALIGSSVLGLASLLVVAEGLSALRPVVLTTDPGGAALSLPRFTLRRGLTRVVVPVDEIKDVEFDFLRLNRTGRWQLVVTRVDGSEIRCDSVTGAAKMVVEGSEQRRLVQQLHNEVVAAQRG